MGADGISRLVAVTQMRTEDANDEALHGADQQRNTLSQLRQLRAEKAAIADKTRDKDITGKEYQEINAILSNEGLSTKGVDGGKDGLLSNGLAPGQQAPQFRIFGQSFTPNFYNPDFNWRNSNPWVAKFFPPPPPPEFHAKLGAEGEAKNNQDVIDKITAALDDKEKDLEASDKLGDFDVQRLMSEYNQSETLASSIQKNVDEGSKTLIGKI